MINIKKISNSFEETLKGSNLHNVAIDLTEILTDSFLKDGLLKDIPIISTFLGLCGTSQKIADYLFLKKTLTFLNELKDIDPLERSKMISSIDSSKKFRIKVGEKLLYIIDKCDDHENAQYVAKLFSAFLENKLDYSDFLRGSIIIERIFIDDFIVFLKDDKTVIEINDAEDLLHTGLYEVYAEDIQVEDQDDWKSSGRYKVDGGKARAYTTSIGDKIREILKIN